MLKFLYFANVQRDFFDLKGVRWVALKSGGGLL